MFKQYQYTNFRDQPPKDYEVHFVTPWKSLWSWSVAPTSYNRSIEFESNYKRELWVRCKGMNWKIVDFQVMPADKARKLVSSVKSRIAADTPRMKSWEEVFEFSNYETAPEIGHVVIQTEMERNVTLEDDMGDERVLKVARQLVRPKIKLILRVPVDLLEETLDTDAYERFVTIPKRYTI